MVNNKKVRRATLSIALSICMVISMMPTAFAASATDFKDVSSTDWYYNSVEYVAEKGYFSGITNDTFAPAQPMTRAMFVTVLARADGATINNNVSPFDDVKSGEWYSGAVAWAVENKLVSGVGNNKFAPDQNVTRQDMATLMARYIEYYTAKNKVTFEKKGAAKTFTDADKIASYAKDAVTLCVSYGLIDGYTDGSFGPTETSTRAQVAAVVQRLSKTIETGKAVEEPVPDDKKDEQQTDNNTTGHKSSKNKNSDVSAATAADFEAAAEVARTNVTATIEEENSLTVNDDITIDNDSVSTLTLNLGNAKLGNLTINAANAGTITINGTGSMKSLTINAPNASVTNNVTVNGNVNIKAVSQNTFNSCAEIKGIIYFDGPGAIAFETSSGSSSDVFAPEIVINTPESVTLKENKDETQAANIIPQVKVVADNAKLTVATPAKVESTAAEVNLKVNTEKQVEISGTVNSVTANTEKPSLKVEGTVENIVAQEAKSITINGAGSISTMDTGAAAVTVEKSSDSDKDAATVSIEKIIAASGGSITAPENTINTVSITGEVSLAAPVQSVTAGSNAKLTLDNNVVIPTIEAEGDLTLEGSGTVTSIDVKTETAATITSNSENVEVAQVTKTATNTKDITVRGLDVAVATKAAKPENLEAVPPTEANGNGAIKGVTTKMEYKGGNVTDWAPISNVTDDSMTFAPGTYQVRVKADTTNNVLASEAVTVTITKAVGVKSAEIQGTPYVGQTLTAVANADATGTLSYEWKAGDTVIGKNSKTLTLTDGMVGKTITVKISNYKGTNESGDNQDTKTSVETSKVTVDKTALNNLLAKATEVQQGITVEDNGTTESQVPVGVKFVTTSEATALSNAITAARAVNIDTAKSSEVTGQEIKLRAGINTYEKAIKTGKYDNVVALQSALNTLIDTANTIKTNVVIDSDAKNVAPDKQWVTSDVANTYSAAILNAQGKTGNDNAEELSEAVSELNTAITTYIKALQKGAALDNSALVAAINAANINAASVATSTLNGTDVLPSNNWVTENDKTDYTRAINTAKNKEATTQSDYDSALSALNEATTEFNAAKKAGTKDIVAPVVTNVSATLNNEGKASISFTTNEAGSYAYKIGKDGDYSSSSNIAAGCTIFFNTDETVTSDSEITIRVMDSSNNATEFTIKPVSNSYVAKIGDKTYESLAAAINDAGSGATIKLMKNIKLSETAVVTKDLTIDLNGKTIEGTNTRAIHVKSGTLTLTGTGTVTSTGSISIDGSVIRVGDGKTYEEKTGTPAGLVVDINVTISAPASYGVTAFGGDTTETVIIKGKVQATGYSEEKPYDGCAVSTVGSDKFTPATITIEDSAVITATKTNAVYVPAGTLNVKGGKITGTTGIYFKSTNMTISGGTITGNGDKADYKYYGNGGYSTGEAVTIDSCNYPGGIGSVVISGGIFNSEKADAIGSYSSNEAYPVIGFIAGGTFSSDPGDCVAAEYVAKAENGKYVVSLRGEDDATTVVEIDDKYYASLSDAISDAKEGDTIKLVLDETISSDDYNVNKRLYVSKDNVTIDLNQKTLSVPNCTLTITGNNITLKNGVMVATSTINSQKNGSYVTQVKGKNVTIENITMTGGVNVSGVNSADTEKPDSTVTITGCDITATNYYTVCAQRNSAVTIEGSKLTGKTDGNFFWVEKVGYKEGNDPAASVDSQIVCGERNTLVGTKTTLYNTVGVKPIIIGGTFSVDPTQYLAEGYKATKSGESGSEVWTVTAALDQDDSGAYLINTVADLTEFRDEVNSGRDFEGKTVKLTDNITLTGEWTPIGNGTRSGNTYTGNAFKGTFDGGDNTISGLIISTGTAANGGTGLFGIVAGGTVENLNIVANIHDVDGQNVGGAVGILVDGKVSKVKVSGSVTALEAAGGVVGRVLAVGTVENCENSATVESTSTSDAAGGIVGKAYYTVAGKEMSIISCKNTGEVKGKYAVGGIVGFSAANVKNCENSGTISTEGTNITSVGGIIGEQTNYGEISGNKNTVAINVTGTGNAAVGGIIGWIRYQNSASYDNNEAIAVKDNENSGSVSATTGMAAGGIVGLAYNHATVTENTNTAASISGGTFVSGIVGGLQKNGDNLTIGTPTAENPRFVVTGNQTTTGMANITGSCKDLVAYNNDATNNTFAKISDNTTPEDTSVTND